MMNAGGLIHQQPSTVPMVNATTTATNTGCVPVQFFNGFLDGTDSGLIHHQQQQVPLQQILRTQMPGSSFFASISDTKCGICHFIISILFYSYHLVILFHF